MCYFLYFWILGSKRAWQFLKLRTHPVMNLQLGAEKQQVSNIVPPFRWKMEKGWGKMQKIILSGVQCFMRSQLWSVYHNVYHKFYFHMLFQFCLSIIMAHEGCNSNGKAISAALLFEIAGLRACEFFLGLKQRENHNKVGRVGRLPVGSRFVIFVVFRCKLQRHHFRKSAEQCLTIGAAE